MKNIKKFCYSCMLAGFIMLVSACEEGFDEMNINPVALTSVNPALQLNHAIVSSAPTLNNITNETTIVKQKFRIFTGVQAGANFNQNVKSSFENNWNSGYRNILKNTIDVIEKTKDDPERSNLYNMARIWKAFHFMIITDTYGDVPYSEAGRGYLEGLVFPVYDSQESIYMDILNELETASASLDASKPIATQDVLYSGDITKWKRLGNSLLLRAAMRLSKVSSNVAQDYVAKAIAGGLMQSNDDNALIRHNANFQNPVGNSINGGQSWFNYLTRDFVDHLKTTNDPRLGAISVRYAGALGGGDQTEALATRDPQEQIGMPMGYDNTNIDPVAQAEGLASFYAYSQLDRTRMGDPQAPSFLVTYSLTQLLLAEAVSRNWAQGDAAQLFSNGVRAHMEQLALYGESTAIPESEINAYLQANPLDNNSALEQINTQYWIASFLIGPETWANFRRSGYPDLEPNPFPGNDLKTEDFIRRLTYTDAELSVNSENVNQAIARQGPDLIDTRIWWDVK